MLLFLGGLALLVAGYFTYGRIVERIVGPDDRETPAVRNPDGVDYLELPKWKNMLIQLLNIAGPGPVIGAIAGVKFGRVAFIIIPLGCILMGAVHDFVHGMVSLRSNGANLPQTVRENLGGGFAWGIAWLLIVLLLLATAVMINIPSTLIDKTFVPDYPVFWWSAAVIFVYYIVATLFPVDAIIGRVYPLFGVVLLVGSAAMLVVLVWNAVLDPSILQESEAFLRYRAEEFNAGGRSPIFPLLFVTIACGVASGAHATQTPIVARTLRSEREARAAFYGMMIAEGVIAMIWAAAALSIYNIAPENLSLPPAQVLVNAVRHHLGQGLGMLTVAGVIILIITSGDTGLRSLRLIAADAVGVEQRSVRSRILVCLPLVALVAIILWWSNANPSSFGVLWNYFSWLNQTLVAVTLMACTVWLLRRGKGWRCVVTLLPGLFYATVAVSFILWTSADRGQPWGFGLPLPVAVACGAFAALVLAVCVLRRAADSGSASSRQDKKGEPNMKRLMMAGAVLALVLCGGAAEKPALVAEDITFEKRSDGLVDLRFRVKNDLVKDALVLARVRAHYLGWMMLNTDSLYRRNQDGSRGALVGCDVQLQASEREVHLVWDAPRDMPHDLTLDGAIKDGLWISVDLEPQPPEVRVKCQNGVMVGEQHGAGLADGLTPRTLTFFGVPFAKPPVGSRRWKAPEWPDASDAEVCTKKFAPSPIQKLVTDETSSSTRCHEDCLYLNLWTGWTDEAQPIKGNENKPVLVFIHGGAFCEGGSKEAISDCSRLAERYGKDVIFVTIEYRLALFGFFDFTGVPGWSYEKYPDHGRIMLLDQQMALKWLKRNIRAFGGDPDRITIAGESAGGISVALLMANFNRDDDGSPLFRRAIPMSGAFNTFGRETFRKINMGQVLCEALTKTANRPFRTMDDLQNATEEEMWKAYLFPLDKIETIHELPPLCRNEHVCDLILGPLAEGDARDGSDRYACIGTNAYDVIARNAKDVDLFTGDVAHESRYWANAFIQEGAENPLQFYYENYVPMVIGSYRQFGPEAVDQYIRQIDEPDDHDPKLNFGYPDIWSKTALISEMQFRIPQIRLASAYADSTIRGKGRVYMYHFRKAQILKDRIWVRSMHATELPYLFDQQKFTDYGPLDRSLQARFSEMMVEFVKTGVPRYRNEGGELMAVPEYRTVGDERKTVVIGDDGKFAIESDPWSWQRKLLQPVSERVPPGIF